MQLPADRELRLAGLEVLGADVGATALRFLTELSGTFFELEQIDEPP